MSNFSLNQLPYTLKTSIFSNLELEDSFQLLRTTKELRHSVLNHGPSPRTITSLTFQVSRPEIIDGVIDFDDPLRFFFDTTSKSYRLPIREQRKAFDKNSSIQITKEDLRRLFEKMCIVRKIDLLLDDGPIKNGLGKLLNKFRFIGELEILSDHIGYLSAILPSLSAKIENEFLLILRVQHEDLETFGGSEIREFFSSNLIDCKKIELHDIGPIGKNPNVYAALQKTNFSFLRLRFVRADDFWVAVEEFLIIGAPSRNREAEMDFTCLIDDEGIENLEYPPEIDEFLRRHTVKIDALAEKKRLLDEFSSTNYAEIDEIDLFRRILEENTRILYIFGLYDGHPRFRAKVKPICRSIF